MSSSPPPEPEPEAELYGLFQLRTSQQHALGAMADLLEQLVTSNAMLDLQKVAEDPDSCDSLFILSSSSHKNEFQDMRFPDPANPSQARIVSYISKNVYDAKAKNDQSPRKIMCAQIGFFAVRLITLVSALLVSVKLHPTMTTALFSTRKAAPAGFNERYQDPILPGSPRPMVGGSVSATVIESLIKSGAFRRARAGEREDVRPLYFFGNKDSVVIDAARDIVYAPQLRQTGVLRITIEPIVDSPTHPTRMNHPTRINSNRRRANFPPGPIRPYPDRREYEDSRDYEDRRVPRYLRENRFGGGTRYSSRSSRRSRMTGGGKHFLVTLFKFLECGATGCAEVDKFVMDIAGNTISYDDFRSHRNVPTSKEFHDRVGALLSKPSVAGLVKNISPSKEVVDRTIRSDSFAPLGKLDISVYKRFVAIKDTILNGKLEGYSPASYRAFLLASQLEADLVTGAKGALNSLFCSDGWQGRDVHTTVAYSLLQSLYKDLPTGDITSRSAKECESAVQKHTAMARIKTPGSAPPTRYDELAFRTLPEALTPFCASQSDSGSRPILSEAHKRILMNAHQELRALYDDHLEACLQLLRTVLYFGSGATYLSPAKIRLDDEFRKHPRGSQIALEEKIADARALLAAHYLSVETVYHTALKKLSDITMSEMPPQVVVVTNGTAPRSASNATNRLNRVADELASNK